MQYSNKDLYTKAATNALAVFQLIESGLKVYIEQYYEALMLIIGNKLRFKFDSNDISNTPLGILCKHFSKLNNNDNLVAQIKTITKHRDEIAHRF